MVFGHGHVTHRASPEDHLAAGVGIGLEQYGIHVGVGRQPAGRRLQGLGPADLPAFGRYGGVEGHVLGFEGGDGKAAAFQNAAQSRRQDTFTDIAPRPANEEGSRRVRDAGRRRRNENVLALISASLVPRPSSLNRISARSNDPPRRVEPRLRVADDDDAEHVDGVIEQGAEVRHRHLLPIAAGVAHYAHRGCRGAVPQKGLPSLADLRRAPLASGVVEGDHEIRGGGGGEATADQRPGGQQV